MGVRGALMAETGSGANATTGAAQFAGEADEYRTKAIFTEHLEGHFGIGGGSGGFEGALGGLFAFGARAPITPTQGPLFRAGATGELLGNKYFYFSHLELPVIDVGYQFQSGRSLIDFGGRAAPVLTGRFNSGDVASHELGNFEFGGYLALHSKYGRLDASIARITGNGSPATPVDFARGIACVYVAKVVGFCADALAIRGAVTLPTITAPVAAAAGATIGNPEVRAFYGGLMVGLTTD
jgi:hypothetical protein